MEATLEHLPDEIFMELFEYVSMQNLYKSFSGLNRRIETILGSIQTRLSLQWRRPNQTDDPCITFFAHRITKLSVRHNQPLNLRRFMNIRCLELEEPSKEQCNEIQPHIVPYLKHLRINNNNTRRTPITFQQLCHLVFSNAFSSLQTCVLNNIQFDNRWSTTLCSLRSLQIDAQNSQSLSVLLDACPALVRLKVMLDDQSIDFSDRATHTALRRMELYLRINHWSCEDLEFLLTCMPNLEYLSIHTPFGQSSNMIVESLANILTRCTPNLRYFYINTMINKPPSESVIRQLHPLFENVRLTQSVTCRAEHITIISKKSR